VSGSGISWDICKSAPRSRQITTPAPHHSVPFLPFNQQRQSTEGTFMLWLLVINCIDKILLILSDRHVCMCCMDCVVFVHLVF